MAAASARQIKDTPRSGAAARTPGVAVKALRIVAGARRGCWLAAGFAGARRFEVSMSPHARRPRCRFKVAGGARFARVAAELAARGVLAQPRAWVLYARWKGLASAIKAGEYEIEPGATPRALLEKMVSGQVMLHSLTIVDGWRVQDHARRAANAIPTSPATLPASPRDLMDRLGAPGVAAEGQFLPETYRFPTGTTRPRAAAPGARGPAARARRPPGRIAIRDLPLQTPGAADHGLHRRKGERVAAGAAENRRPVPATACASACGCRRIPTVIYGLGERYDGELHTVDLRTDGPYNTYTRTGLPPTPIALAGAAAIRATAHPEKTDASVLRGLGQGRRQPCVLRRRSKSTMQQWRTTSRSQRQARGGGGKMSAHGRTILDHRGHRGRGQEHADRAPFARAFRSRDRARGDARARRHAARGEDPRAGAAPARRGAAARPPSFC